MSIRLNKTSVFTAITLAENKQVPQEVQVLRVGSFKHPQYGKFEITQAILAEMKKNFDDRVRGIDVAFDYYHASDQDASAWVGGLELREDGNELWATNVDWTPKAIEKLSNRELRYFSPDFAFQWSDPESGAVFNNVLFGGGLTNRPFVKEMKAIVADEIKGEQMTELEKAQAKLKEVEAANIKLSEQVADQEKKMADMVPKADAPAAGGDDVAGLKKQLADLQAKYDEMCKQNEANLAEKKKADEAAKLAEKKNKFNVMLSEGKAVKAQEDAYLKGDMDEFMKLAQPLNLKGGGTTAVVEGHDDDTKAIIKLAEEKMKTNPKLQKFEAISIAKRELKK